MSNKKRTTLDKVKADLWFKKHKHKNKNIPSTADIFDLVAAYSDIDADILRSMIKQQ